MNYLPIIVTFLLTNFALSEDSAVKPVALSNSEIQEVLQIKAWKVRIPKDFGDRPRLVFEQYVGDKRVSLSESGLTLHEGSSREVLVTIRSGPDHYYVYHKSGGRSGWREVPSNIVKTHENGGVVYIDSLSTVNIKKHRIDLMVWEHKTRKDTSKGVGEGNPETVLAKRLLSIVKTR